MSEKFLLDSNVFITPHRLYYPFDFASGFWDQMEQKLYSDSVIVLDVVATEIKKSEDELANWLNSLEDFKPVTVKQESILANYSEVLKFVQTSGYYKDQALREWSSAGIADPWIIAAAISLGATIITFETPSGSLSKNNASKRAKIPDVAGSFDVKCEDLFYFMRQTGFRL